MSRNVGATLSLNSGNFFVNMKSAINASNNLKNTLNGTTGGMKSFGAQSASTGNVLTSLASKAAVAVGAFASIRSAVNFGKDVVNTGLEFELVNRTVARILVNVGIEQAFVHDTVERDISCKRRARKSAKHGKRAKCLLHN